ncbi:hypothetical protein Acsp03_15090 [Actinomadura sp. NBRC 104412]|nr:hypothetical protein Acsp03_15090 [Actinomadura sp. NBRC 104412]
MTRPFTILGRNHDLGTAVGPAFAVTLIWQFTSMWNDFLFAAFPGAPDSWPVTVIFDNTAGSGAVAVQYDQQMAAALLASLPAPAQDARNPVKLPGWPHQVKIMPCGVPR